MLETNEVSGQWVGQQTARRGCDLKYAPNRMKVKLGGCVQHPDASQRRADSRVGGESGGHWSRNDILVLLKVGECSEGEAPVRDLGRPGLNDSYHDHIKAH